MGVPMQLLNAAVLRRAALSVALVVWIAGCSGQALFKHYPCRGVVTLIPSHKPQIVERLCRVQFVAHSQRDERVA